MVAESSFADFAAFVAMGILGLFIGYQIGRAAYDDRGYLRNRMKHQQELLDGLKKN